MTPHVCDTLELDGQTFEIIRVVDRDAPSSFVDPDPVGLPAALVCTGCGCRTFGCTFRLIDSRLHLVALISRGEPLDEVRHAGWLLPQPPGSTSNNLQLHRLPVFSGTLVVAKGRMTLDLDEDEPVMDFTDLEPWAEFDDVHELDFVNGKLRSRIDCSADAAHVRGDLGNDYDPGH